MHQLGDQAYKETRLKTKRSKDMKLKATVVRIGKRIAAASGKNFKWHFTLFDAPKTVNAFCLPGGKVGVYTGIIPVAKTEAGLAAIMGHEVAHAILRHGAERVSHGMITKAGLSLAGLAFNDSKYKSGILKALGLGAQVGVILPYSRSHETEADIIGLKYMAKAGYNPNAAVSLWKRMAKLGGAGKMEILSTHPNPLKRAEALRREIPKVMGLYNASTKQPTKNLQ